MNGYHVPVMADEVIENLRIQPHGTYLDCTLGGGGHTERILQAGGCVLALDKDVEAIDYATTRLCAGGGYGGRFTIVKSDFKAACDVLDRQGIAALDGAVMDLGISSHQVDDASRGFSYRFDSELDMRMDRSQVKSAMNVVNEYSEEELARILFTYGEERFAKKIARAIVAERAKTPVETTGRLADIVASCMPYQKNGHPAKKTFQAIRIEVNNELSGLGEAVGDIVGRLKRGGRICVITFHSLEDRIVKQTLASLAAGCICDKSLPVCVCGHVAEVKTVGKYKATAEELDRNPRAASATLRVAEKL
ncbi:MAG: 16S rRNA (cytosine(1402)-N(4))-methyltransferase RsmH [Clostridia bacterium]|jgi:16S rRNA (cytosine1402-N4)-methyltransferase|nr:16S rRNA (cytosine(1402)-N(4))-methyltransferase RsmH [Clostridia bacterium]